MVSPVLAPGARARDVYFPPASTWYAYVTGTGDAAWHGMVRGVAVPLERIAVHVRGGSIIPLQPVGAALTTVDARTQPFALLVRLARPLCRG